MNMDDVGATHFAKEAQFFASLGDQLIFVLGCGLRGLHGLVGHGLNRSHRSLVAGLESRPQTSYFNWRAGPSSAKIQAMSEQNRPPLPDHLSIDPKSPHFVAAVFEHDVGIRLNGRQRFDVEEYCVSEGWIKVPAGKTLNRKGQPLLIKLKGQVEVFYP